MGFKARGAGLGEFSRFLRRKGPRPVSPAKLRREIPAHIEIPKDVGPFLRSDELARRYGIELPPIIAALFELGDELAIEDYRPELGWKYLRVGPGGWEPPTGEIGLPLLNEYVKRFEWNAFSNMQLWEAFAGVVCVGWHDDGNRLFASIVSGDSAPVLWMDHELGVLGGFVAGSLVELLEHCMGKSVSPLAKRALKDPHEHTFRMKLPAHRDPLQLQARSSWILHLLAWADPKSADRVIGDDRTAPGDYAREAELMASTIASPVYWLFRSFFRGEDRLFETALEDSESNPSPLVQSLRIVLPERVADKPVKGFLAKMRRRYSTGR